MSRIGFAERAARTIVRLAATIAPDGWRSELAREWEAELADRFRPEPPRRPPGLLGRLSLLNRSLLSLVDAAYLRARELTLDSIAKDIRFAVRSLLRRPGFTLLTLATIGLGIGANTAIFTVVNSVLLRPLPYPEPGELVMVWEQDRVRGWERVPGSAQDFLVWREETTTMESVAAGSGASFSLTGDAAPERVQGFRVTGDFFDVFGVAPLHGVPFDRASNVAGRDAKVVLSHDLWMRRYGADPSLVGRTIDVDGAPAEVVAVMPRGFHFPSSAEMWVPIVFSEAQFQDRNWHFLLTVGRLAPGATVNAAQAEMATIASRLAQEFPESNGDYGITVQPLHGEMTTNVRDVLLVLLGAVGFVLLIACANVANLLLVRASGRARELSVRTALGAGKARIVRQLLTESVLLAGVGGLLGIGIAQVGLEGILATASITRPGGGEITIDGWVLAATAAGALVTGVAFGLAPVVAIWNTDVQAALKDGRSRTSGAGRRLRSVLVVAEIALALVLVTGAGLMVQSVQRLLDVDVGMDTENALLAQVALPPAAYPEPEEQILFYDRLLDEARALPGVEAAALSTTVPPASGGQYHVRVEGVHEAWTMDLPVARSRAVSANYFEAMGIPLLRGRGFTEDDTYASPLVIVVDEAFVEQHLPDSDPIGQRIRTLLDEPREIVGVVGDVANSGLQNQAGPTTYFPYAQQPFGNQQTIVLRTGSDPNAFVPVLQETIWSLDPNLPLVGIETLEERLADSVQQSRFHSILLTLFAALAAVLAGIGIYGVVTYTVSERTAELGLRMALGASGGDVRGLVLRKAIGLTLSGVALGLVTSLALTRLIESFLYGVEPTDPVTLVVVSVGLCTVALVASVVPARRASRLDPLLALREE